MKILLVGDLHLDSVTPLSRLDNYREVTLKKLGSLFNLALKNKVTHVVLTGDVFDKLDQSAIYMHDVVDMLQQFREHNINVLSIWGNHDLNRDNLEISNKTPLALLFKTGLINYIGNNLKGIKLDDTLTVYGINFTQAEQVDSIILNKDTNNLLVMHYATDNTVPGESIPVSKLTKFDVVLSGHDHMYYSPKQVDNTLILRPGSFTRRTKDAYNLTRNIVVYLYDSELNKATELILPDVKQAVEVFKNEAFLDNTVDFYKKDFDGMFTDDYFNNNATNLSEIVESLPATVFETSKEAVKKYLKTQGFIL